MTATRLNPTIKTTTSNGWTIRRFPDGYTEVRKTFTVTTPNYQTWGTWYEARLVDYVSYPVTFTSDPSVKVEVNSSVSGIIIGEYVGGSSTTTPRVLAVRPSAGSGKIVATLVATGIEA